jgi:hypothetical protein
MNQAKTSFSNEIFAGTTISVVQYSARLRQEPGSLATGLNTKEIQALAASKADKFCPFIVQASSDFLAKEQTMGTRLNGSIRGLPTACMARQITLNYLHAR